MKLASSTSVKSFSLCGLIFFCALLAYLFYHESSFWPRGSWAQTSETPEYVHERFQRSYFSGSDAKKLRRLHYQQAIVFLAVVTCAMAMQDSK
ncbi:MAG TPA: hypothetical protein VKE30_02825 [Chthoniobacterales bacterium]|nr:hypothetical protein [Chthoniobacterales bacterium]